MNFQIENITYQKEFHPQIEFINDNLPFSINGRNTWNEIMQAGYNFNELHYSNDIYKNYADPMNNIEQKFIDQNYCWNQTTNPYVSPNYPRDCRARYFSSFKTQEENDNTTISPDHFGNGENNWYLSQNYLDNSLGKLASKPKLKIDFK